MAFRFGAIVCLNEIDMHRENTENQLQNVSMITAKDKKCIQSKEQSLFRLKKLKKDIAVSSIKINKFRLDEK